MNYSKTNKVLKRLTTYWAAFSKLPSLHEALSELASRTGPTSFAGVRWVFRLEIAQRFARRLCECNNTKKRVNRQRTDQRTALTGIHWTSTLGVISVGAEFGESHSVAESN